MRLIVPGLALAASVLAVAGCGGNDSTTSYTSKTPPAPAGAVAGGDASATAVASTPAPTQTATAAPTQTAAPTATVDPNAAQVTGGKITVKGTEFAFAPSSISAKAGKVTFDFDNAGSTVHELVVLKSDAAPGSLKPGPDGRVSEKTSVGEVSETEAGKTKSSTITFKKPGRYILVCNIPGHYQSGMYGSLVVR